MNGFIFRVSLQRDLRGLRGLRGLKKVSVEAKKKVFEKRRSLQVKIISFEKKWSTMGLLDGVDDVKMMNPHHSHTQSNTDDEDADDADGFEEDEEDEVEVTPEKVVLLLPSNITSECRGMMGLEALSNQEAELRVGQMNDTLQRLRIALGEKSLTFRAKVSHYQVCSIAQLKKYRFEMQIVSDSQLKLGVR